jgi:3'-5' exoribonuclease
VPFSALTICVRDHHDSAPDRLTLTQLRQVVTATPQPATVHAQVEARHEKTTSQGAPYLELKISDAGDSLVWRVFDSNPVFAAARELKRGDAIELAAQWADAGKFGVEPKQPSMRRLTEQEAQILLLGDPGLAAKQRADFDEILARAHAIADPRLRALCLAFFEKHEERFRRAGAARENHHARRGGLVEHVAQMMRCADAVCGVYPHLNRDLLAAGIIFHDCGKLWENNYPEAGFTQPVNLMGEMLGHIPLGMELVNKLWRDILDRPEAAAWASLEPASEFVRLHLLHLIGAHHGQLEFGSPVLPKTPEAIVLHQVDNVDAKLEMLRRGYETAKEIAPGIFERFRPWPVNVVAPLPSVAAPVPSEAVEPEEQAAGQDG